MNEFCAFRAATGVLYTGFLTACLVTSILPVGANVGAGIFTIVVLLTGLVYGCRKIAAA